MVTNGINLSLIAFASFQVFSPGKASLNCVNESPKSCIGWFLRSVFFAHFALFGGRCGASIWGVLWVVTGKSG
jgi:hypothetical protein